MRRLNPKDTTNPKTIAYIFYGNNETKDQITADAFLNHLGNMHKAVLLQTVNNFNMFDQTVVQEEKDNFFQLLADSVNKIGWYTGGDLILIVNNEIVANIQLKTIQNLSSNKTQSSDPLKTSNISSMVNELKQEYTKDKIKEIDNFVDKVYSMFKTSAVVHKIGNEITELPIDYAKKNLSKEFVRPGNNTKFKITFS